jgi:GLPGLI family protein
MNTFKSIKWFLIICSSIGYSCSSIKNNAHYDPEKSRHKCAYKFDILSDTLLMNYFREEIYIVQIGNNLTKGFTHQKFYLDSLKRYNPELHKKLFNLSLSESIEAMRRTGDVSHMHNNSFHNGYFPSDIYKDYKKKEIRVRDDLYIKSFIYKDELKPQFWEILSDTTTVLGYFSQKAICRWRGRDWIAWFTPEIPISEGPWKFYGLPGLITKLHDENKHYSFELIGFQEIEEIIGTEIPKDTQKIGRVEFFKAKFGNQGDMMLKADMDAIGLKNDEPRRKNEYDGIERDYK